MAPALIPITDTTRVAEPLTRHIDREAIPVAPIRHPPGRPRQSAPKATNPITELLSTGFELVIHLLRDDLRVKDKGRTKTMKQDPLKKGPVAVQFGTSWDAFRALVSAAITIPIEYLTVDTFEYHLSMPANSPKVPVSSALSFESMLRQLQAQSVKKPLPVIILRMRNPQYIAPVCLLD